MPCYGFADQQPRIDNEHVPYRWTYGRTDTNKYYDSLIMLQSVVFISPDNGLLARYLDLIRWEASRLSRQFQRMPHPL